MRSVVIVAVMGSIASAEPLPVDVLTNGQPGDWTLFDGVRLDNGKLVEDRAVVILKIPRSYGGAGNRVDFNRVEVRWDRGDPKKPLAWWREQTFRGPIDHDLFGVTSTTKNFKTAPATCRLDEPFPCTKVTFSGIGELGKEVSVTALMDKRVRGSGIVELEVMDGTTLLLRYKAKGYGDAHGNGWGVSLKGVMVEPKQRPQGYPSAGGREVSGKGIYPGDLLKKAAVGHWAIYEGESTIDKKLVADRMLVLIDKRGTDLVPTWFRHEKGTEPPWQPSRWSMDLHAAVAAITEYNAGDPRSETATCKLATAVDCTRHTFWMDDPDRVSTKVAVVVTTTNRVRGPGIAEVEIKLDKIVLLRAKVVAYGVGDRAEWGGQAPTKAQLAKLYESNKRAHDAELGMPGSVGDGGSPSGEQQIATMSTIEAKGDLDKAIIRRYLKRNLQKLTYCYEQQLPKKPKLKGKVSFELSITPNGNVSSATAQGLDPEIEKCAAAVIKGIEFPKPKGDKGVDVKFSIDYEIPKPKPRAR